MAITGNFQVSGHISQLPLHRDIDDKKLSLACNVLIDINGKRLSIAVDNSAGFGRLKIIRESIMLLQGDAKEVRTQLIPRAEDEVLDGPDEQQLMDAFAWLISSD